MAVSDAEIERRIDQLVDEFPPATTDEVAFLGAQFDAGLAWAHFPEGLGGLGASPTQQMRVLQRLAAAHAPSAVMRNVIGYGMVAPDARHPRHARAAAALPAPPLHGRGGLVPALLRARRGLGRRGPGDPGRARR